MQWLRRKIITFMGNVYVWLDKGLVHPTGPIYLRPKIETYCSKDWIIVEIDDDLDEMGRKELCRYIEEQFGWPEDSFWNLESTQKIRLCCQIARSNKFEVKK